MVNDTFGHDAGDRLLAETGRRLESCVGPADLVARVGAMSSPSCPKEFGPQTRFPVSPSVSVHASKSLFVFRTNRSMSLSASESL